MKSRRNLAIISALTIPACLIWFESRKEAPVAPPADKSNSIALIAVPLPVTPVVAAAPQPVAASTPAPAPVPAPVVDTLGSDGQIKHIAQAGETVTSLATDLMGKDSKINRDAIISANSSLKADPDKLVAGKAYHIPTVVEVPAVEVSAVAPAPVAQPVVVVAPQPAAVEVVQPKPSKELRYTATEGDTVGKLAGAFLGNDDQNHQDKIINANPSLQADPDRVLAGKTYRIPAPDGLSATANPSPGNVTPRPTTQPDSDQVITAASPRMLRYTARAGDTVTTMAIQLLGSDTQEARDTIISNNPSLKKNPDRLIAGQSYSIPAPAAAASNP